LYNSIAPARFRNTRNATIRKQPNLVFFIGEGQRADAMSIACHPLLKLRTTTALGAKA
jgi:hypothetical protein